MQQAVQEAHRCGLLEQEPAPGLERPVAGYPERAPFVGGGDKTEQQLRAGVERSEPYFIDQDQVVAEQGVDHFADGVVG
jgi:hypothetical protein